MRTNIDLDDNLVEESMKLSGVKTKKEVVHLALSELLKNLKKKPLSDLKGKIRFQDGYNYKDLRAGR